MDITLPSEFALVAACCQWPPSPAREAAIRAAAARPIDWDRFLGVVERQRVVALVVDGLHGAGIVPPPPLAEALLARAGRSGRMALMMARESLRLQAAFDAAGLPALVIKGSGMAMLAYGRHGMKQSWDIDLLTLPQSAVQARHALERLGYVLTMPAGLDDGSFARAASFSKECEFTNAALRCVVELHFRLIDNAYLIPDVGSGSAGQAVDLGGGAIRTLADEPLFAYLCVHGMIHAWVRLKWLADVAAFLSRRDAAGIERLYRAAVALGAGRTPAVTLLLCHRLLGLGLPATLIDELRADPMTRRLVANTIACMIHRGGAEAFEPYSLPSMRIQWSHFFLVPGHRYFRSEMAVKWRSGGDRTRIVLPPSLDFLYPLLRLPLWLWRIGRRFFGRATSWIGSHAGGS